MFEWFNHQGVQGTCSQSNMHENANILLWCMWNGRWFQCFFGFVIQFRQWHVIGEAPVQWEILGGHELGVSEFQGDFYQITSKSMKFCLFTSLYLLCNINIEKLKHTGKKIRKVLSLKGLFWSNNTYFMVECITHSGLFSNFGLPIHSFQCHSQSNYCSWLYKWNTCCHNYQIFPSVPGCMMSVMREEKGVQVLSESVKSLWKLRTQVCVIVLKFFL